MVHQPKWILTDDEIGAQLLSIVRGAQSYLVFVSPYVQLWEHLRVVLRDAVGRGVETTLLVRNDDDGRSSEDLRWLTEQGVTVVAIDWLHAKIYFSEREMLVSSMNLHRSSMQNSREIAWVVTEETPQKQVVDFVRGLLTAGVRLVPEQPSEPAELLAGEGGHCIRCGVTISLDPSRPLCEEHYQVWLRYSKNPHHEEKFCHVCGEPRAVTYAKPLCSRCFAAER